MNVPYQGEVPSLLKLHALMDEIIDETHKSLQTENIAKGRLASDPFLNAIDELWVAVREATDRVILQGSRVLEEVYQRTLKRWEEVRDSMHGEVQRLLDCFCGQLAAEYLALRPLDKRRRGDCSNKGRAFALTTARRCAFTANG